MAVESRGDLASRHGSIVRIAGAHSWSYRSDNPICTRTHLLEQIKIAAHKRDVPYQSLMKVWLSEKVES